MAALYDIQPFTMLDFPGETACIAWFSGCNLRCVYCHNPEIVLSKGKRDEEEIFTFLQKRVGRLTGIVFSGGEPTFVPNLPELAAKAKAMGFKVKLDTNGSNPEVVERLVREKLIDYVALDYKCPAEKAKALIGTDKFVAAFRKTLVFLIQASKEGLGFEVRTTAHADLMDEDDLNGMIADLEALGYQGTYYIQNIGAVGDKTLGNIAEPSREIDREKLTQPKGFELAFRNFKKKPEREGTED